MGKREYYRTHMACLLAMLGLLLCLMANAAQARTLTLDARTMDTAGYLERLDDAGGARPVEQIEQASGWTALPGSVGAGFTPAAVWVRLKVEVKDHAPGGWMLRFSNAVLDEVQAYVRNGEGWTLLGRSGENLRRQEWPVDYRTPVIPFDPAGPGVYEILLRLESKNALVTRVEVWQRLAYDNQSRREGLLFGLYFGFYLLLICLHAGFWWSTRAPMSGLFLAYIGNCVFNEVLSLGLVQQLTGIPVGWSDSLLGVGIAISMPVALRVAFRQLELGALYPRTVRWVDRLFWLIAAGSAGLVLTGHYGLAMAPIQSLALLVIVVLSSLAGYLLWRGWRPARFFALAFGIFYAGILLAFMRNLGMLPVNAFTEYVSTLATMLHMLLLSLAIIGRHERQRRAMERRQANLEADLARQHSQRLEGEVALRTAEMRNEIQRRKVLETELRASLDMERKVLDEQREFVAMVSHEFRTPLAIITTSAQQLSRNLHAPAEKSQARCGNIRDAATRLLALVDEYLTDDRMHEPRSQLRLELCNVEQLLSDLEHGFAPGRIVIEPHVCVPDLVCDAGMLRIALRNLLANADRHCAEGEQVHVRLTQRDGVLYIEIANPGAEIPPADQARLFQKYYRGQNALGRPGAGLGLYLVRRIAERLGGTAMLVSAGGPAPICFRLSLPQGRNAQICNI